MGLTALVSVGLAGALFELHGRAMGPGQSFTFLQIGFTQELIGRAQELLTGDVDEDGVPDGILGGVAFAGDGDPLVTECEFAGTRLHRFDLQGTPINDHGTDLAPGAALPSAGGCGVVNHPDGTLYVAMNDGIYGIANVNRETGALIGFMGPPANSLGIAVDPQTNDLVYAGGDCRFTGTCTFFRLNTTTGVATIFGSLTDTDAEFVDGMYFDPSGEFLFVANRSPFSALTILNRAGAVVQHVMMSSEPDGVAFHAESPKFVVTNNTDGTMTRFDFPGDDYTLPPVVDTFASGGFRGDLSQVGADGCIYLTQKGTRYNDGTTTAPTDQENSVVRVCGGFAPPPGVENEPEPELGSIAGTVYHDVDRNGIRDSGEPGIGDVLVTMTLPDASVATATTATNGTYSFNDLAAGNYSVSSPAVADGKALATASPLDVTLAEGETRTDVDFGYVTGSISGYAYVDTNGNGMRDASEPGIPNVTIALGGPLASTTTTGPDGSYTFEQLNADTYSTASEVTAAGYMLSTASPLSVTLSPGEERSEVNFGYVPGGLSGYAYVDANDNGQRDASEAGIGNVTITRDGSATTTTAADGSYAFDGLVAGTYSVSAPATAGARNRSTPSPLGVTLAAGEHRPEINFGYVDAPAVCPDTTFDFSGSSADSGTPGNVRTFTANGQSVRAKGWSATKSGSFSPAYLALYSMGLGVTDQTEGDGSNNRHTVDNYDQNNYVVFTFQQSVVVDRIYLGYVVNDSDIRVWIGNIPNAYATGVTLNNTVLNNLGYTEVSTGGNAVRWADINAAQVAGNVLVVAAKPDETTDYVKIDKIMVSCPAGGQGILTLTCPANNQGTVGSAFNGALAVSGGVAPYTFSIQSGNLPNGLSLNPTTGAITGTPTTAGSFSFTAQVTDSTGGAAQSDTSACGIGISAPAPACVQTTLTFTGNSAVNGTRGNIRSYTLNGVPVRVSAFSRSTNGSWATAFLGVWSQGFGVTASTETGEGGTHRVDNVGGTNNFVLFEFANPVIVDAAFLNSVVQDSDMSVWVRTSNNPYANHLTLSDSLLNSSPVREDDHGGSSARWANFNGGRVSGNALIISASKSDTSPDDQFKINKLSVCK
jgi:hypothetical protein